MATSMALMVPIFLACVFLPSTMADYNCICTYQVETNIYEHPDVNSNVLDSMYEFDCKPAYDLAWVPANFQPIGNNHVLGFIEVATQNSMQVCQGSIPSLDKVPPEYLTAPPTTTTTTQAITTTQPTTTTTPPPPTTTKTQTTTTTSPTTTATTTMQMTTNSTTRPTTATPLKTTTRMSSPDTTLVSTVLSTITTKTPKPTATTAATTVTTVPPIAITNSSTTAKTSSTASTTSTSKPSTRTTTLPTLVTTYSVHGNTQLCPTTVQSQTSRDKLFVHDRFCYEFVDERNSFIHAQFDCPKRGGVMVYIRDQSDQDFIYQMLISRHRLDPVWIGLHDVNTEEAWEWVSDYPVTYFNWMPSRYIDNSHDKEDCALLVPARKGQWDDVHCVGILFSSPAEHSWICQYNITTSG